MLPKIKGVTPLENYILHVTFDDGKIVLYDVKDDMQTIPAYDDLRIISGLF